VQPEDLRRLGALYVLNENDAVPAGVVAVLPFELVRGDRFGKPARTVRIGVLPPLESCD
jgi:hypothetical protein